MPEKSTTPLTGETVSEALHLEVPHKELWEVFIPHSVYKIKATGYLHYEGKNVWRIDEIVFPADGVETLFIETRKIYLR